MLGDSRRVGILVVTLALTGCPASTSTVYVELRTDFVPGVEFHYVRAHIGEGAMQETAAPHYATFGQDYQAASQRIAEFEGIAPGSYVVRVEMRARPDDRLLGQRRELVTVSGDTVATLQITRLCEDVACPGAGDDPTFTECRGTGVCGPPTCDRDPVTCAARCVADGDCPDLSRCAQAACVGGDCFALSLETCPDGFYCDPEDGCIALPGMDDGGTDAGTDAGGMDAGGMDAGTDAGSDAGSDAGTDAGPSCIPSAEICNGRDDDCNVLADEGTCATNQVCRGVAGCACEAGWFDCTASPGCETPEDEMNCGMCGRRCMGGTPVCDTAADACVSGCPALLDRCGSVCVDTDVDPAHCGGCDQPCDDTNGTPFCMAGTCQIMCDTGFDDCDADAMTGCERSLRTLTDCGGCNVPCAITHTMTSCSTGSCVMTGCETLYDDCDGFASNGCEQYLDTRSHCGACDQGCATNEGCATPGTCHCGPDGSGPSGTGDSVCDDWLPNTLNGRCSGAVPSRCVVVECDSGWNNCDGFHWNGCETSGACP